MPEQAQNEFSQYESKPQTQGDEFAKYLAPTEEESSTIEPGESYQDYFGRVVAHGEKVTPEQIQESYRQGKKELPYVLGAAPLIGAAGGALLDATGAIIGPTSRMVPGGRDALTGRMLPWVEEGGPSLARQGLGAAVDFVKDHPGIIKYPLEVAGLGAAYGIARKIWGAEPPAGPQEQPIAPVPAHRPYIPAQPVATHEPYKPAAPAREESPARRFFGAMYDEAGDIIRPLVEPPRTVPARGLGHAPAPIPLPAKLARDIVNAQASLAKETAEEPMGPPYPLHVAETLTPIAGPIAHHLERYPGWEAAGRGATDALAIAGPELIGRVVGGTAADEAISRFAQRPRAFEAEPGGAITRFNKATGKFEAMGAPTRAGGQVFPSWKGVGAPAVLAEEEEEETRPAEERVEPPTAERIATGMAGTALKAAPAMAAAAGTKAAEALPVRVVPGRPAVSVVAPPPQPAATPVRPKAQGAVPITQIPAEAPRGIPAPAGPIQEAPGYALPAGGTIQAPVSAPPGGMAVPETAPARAAIPVPQARREAEPNEASRLAMQPRKAAGPVSTADITSQAEPPAIMPERAPLPGRTAPAGGAIPLPATTGETPEQRKTREETEERQKRQARIAQQLNEKRLELWAEAAEKGNIEELRKSKEFREVNAKLDSAMAVLRRLMPRRA